MHLLVGSPAGRPTTRQVSAALAQLGTPTVAVEGWLANGRLTPEAEPGLLPAEVYSTAVHNLTGHPAMNSTKAPAV